MASNVAWNRDKLSRPEDEGIGFALFFEDQGFYLWANWSIVGVFIKGTIEGEDVVLAAWDSVVAVMREWSKGGIAGCEGWEVFATKGASWAGIEEADL